MDDIGVDQYSGDGGAAADCAVGKTGGAKVGIRRPDCTPNSSSSAKMRYLLARPAAYSLPGYPAPKFERLLAYPPTP